MSIPEFDLTTKAGVFQALDYMRDTTAKNSIDNKLVSNVNRAIMNNFLDDLNDTEVRKMKNYMDGITSGQYNYDGTMFPLGIVEGDKIVMDIYSSTIAPEKFTIQYEPKIKNGWLLGAPDYHLKASEKVTIDNSKLKPGQYLAISTNRELIFGKNFGDIEIGQTLGGTGLVFHEKAENRPFGFRAFIHTTNDEKDYEMNNCFITIHDSTGLNVSFYGRRNLMLDTTIVRDVKTPVPYAGNYSPDAMAFVNERIVMPEGKKVTYRTLKNGVQTGSGTILSSGGIYQPYQEIGLYGAYIEQGEKDVELEYFLEMVDDDDEGGGVA